MPETSSRAPLDELARPALAYSSTALEYSGPGLLGEAALGYYAEFDAEVRAGSTVRSLRRVKEVESDGTTRRGGVAGSNAILVARVASSCDPHPRSREPRPRR